MAKAPTLEITIEKRGHSFCICLNLNKNIEEIGPFKTKVEAVDVYKILAFEAGDWGWKQSASSLTVDGTVLERHSFFHDTGTFMHLLNSRSASVG